MTSLDVGLVQVIMMSNLVAPDLLQMGVLELLVDPLLNVVLDFVEVLVDSYVDYDYLVSHDQYIYGSIFSGCTYRQVICYSFMDCLKLINIKIMQLHK